MNFFRNTLLAISLCAWGIFAYAADATQAPSGTVTLNLRVLVLTYGQQAESSGGVLSFQGKQYPFNVSGLTIGANNIGASHLVAKGEVYGLADLAKFAGTYVKTEGSIMPITGGQSTLQNENGVIMHLEGTVNGPLDPSTTGAIVTLAK